MKHIQIHLITRLPIFILVAAILTMNLAMTGCGGSTPATGTDNSTPAANSTSAAEKTFTVEELAVYNGKDGNLAYVAVEGVVYDVTKLARWASGLHQDLHFAGADLTDEIKNDSPHGVKILTRATRVGILVK